MELMELINRQAVLDIVEKYACNTQRIYEAVKALPSAQPEVRTQMSSADCISRQAAIGALHDEIVRRRINEDSNDDGALDEFDTETILRRLPPAQPDRDIPTKPGETTSRTWGIREKEPVCPKCGYYLGHWRFQGKHITYCESCGQAIDWEGEGCG